MKSIPNIRFALFVLIMVLLISVVAYSASFGSPITLFYPQNRNYDKESVQDFCIFVEGKGMSIRCVPDYGYALRTEAQKDGVVIFVSVPNGFEVTSDKSIQTAFDNLILRESEPQRTALRRLRYRGGFVSKAEIEAIFFNREKLANLGLDVPKAGLTWDQFGSFLRQMVAANSQSQQISLDEYIPEIRTYTARLFKPIIASSAGTYSFDSTDWIRSDEFLWAVDTTRAVVTAAIQAANARSSRMALLDTKSFSQGRSSMLFAELNVAMSWPSELSWYAIPYPRGPGGQYVSLRQPLIWSVSPENPSFLQGWEFLRWMTVGEGSDFWALHSPLSVTAPVFQGSMPALPVAYGSRGVREVFSTLWDSNNWIEPEAVVQVSPTRTIFYSLVGQVLTPLVAQYIAEELSVEELLQAVEREVLMIKKEVDDSLGL